MSRYDSLRNPLLPALLLATLFVTTSVALTASADDAVSDSGQTADLVCPDVLSIPVRPLAESEARPLCERYAGRVLLIVNTASHCGFTPQFTGLDELYERYADQGFSVLGFPSDGFDQELATEEEVAEFCELNYGVEFPMFQKVSVRGEDAHPIFQALADSGAGEPTWNFNKYLISRDGEVLEHFNASTRPMGRELTDAIESAL